MYVTAHSNSENGPRGGPRLLTRRAALTLLGGTGVASLLAACGSTPTTAQTASGSATSGQAATGGATSAMVSSAPSTAASGASVATSAASSGSTASAASTGHVTTSASSEVQIVLPQSGAKLPTGNVTFTWMDSDDLKAMFEQPFFDAYHKAHPNITIHYDGFAWSQINEIVPLGVRNGNAPDVFAMPQNVPPAEAVNQGWVSPLDDVIPNFSQWRAAFPFGALIPGVHVFNGKVYTFPATSNKRLGHMTMYNLDYMQQAGYDPASNPLTWDQFRAAAKKMTDQGKGQYYGLMLAGQSAPGLAGVVSDLAQLAGAVGGGTNWKTGEYNYTDPQYLAAIQLLLAIKADGSIFPGFMGLGDAEARARVPQGVAGMILDGPWDIPKWPQTNPSFKFGVASPPIPNSGKPTPLTYQETGANQSWLFAKSKYKEVAGDMYYYIGSLAGQTETVIASQGNLTSEFPQANQQAERTNLLNPLAKKAADLADQLMLIGPMPQVRNPDEAQVILELKPVHPDLGEITQGLFTGQVKDAKSAIQTYNDNMNKALDDAIKAAQAKGAKVSRQDWVFPNWDPTKAYTGADYQALPK